VKGEPLRFVLGHSHRRYRWGHVEEGRGYTTPCWIWQGATVGTGYGWWRRRYAHRVAYEAAHGPIPKGMQIDHLCGVKTCINPDHLEAVTQGENLRRAYARGERVVAGAALSGGRERRD
jgi:hypothetical protein